MTIDVPSKQLVRTSARRLLQRFATGVLVGLSLIVLLQMGSSVALTRERVVLVAHSALASGELAFDAHRNEDYFTDCSLLTMLYLRRPSIFRDAVETLFVGPVDHPCTDLGAILAQSSQSLKADLAFQYPNYPFGSRYLAGLMIAAVDLRTAKALCALLSYASVLVLIGGALRNSPAKAALLLPVFVALLFGFAMHRFGHSLAHAPGFFVGFTALSLFLAAPGVFRVFDNRVAFFACLATLIAFFDLMHGSIPVVLSLAIVLNHVFYVMPERPAAQASSGRWLHAAQQMLVVSVCFLTCYVLLTVARLLMLGSIFPAVWNEYASSLAVRLGTEISGRAIAPQDVFQRLWESRFQLVAGGFTPSTWMLVVSVAAWIYAALLLPLALRHRQPQQSDLRIAASVLAAASIGVLAWYWLFPQHAYIHALFAVRYLALPASYGVVAAVLLTQSLAGTPVWTPWRIPLAAMLVSFVIASWVFEGTRSGVAAARFVDHSVADKVACASLGLSADGEPDGLVELSLQSEQASPPLALIGVRPTAPTMMSLRLERSNPPGWWETGGTNYIIGVAREPNGALMNRRDGTVSFPPQRGLVWAHFCRDGHDTPDSRYRVYFGDTELSVDPAR